MSHTMKIKTQVYDAECAELALRKMGYNTIEVHQVAQHLYNYMGNKLNNKAHVIVRRNQFGGSVNDFGIEVGIEGETESFIHIDGRQLDVNKFNQLYGVEVALKDANMRGYFTSEEVMQDGRIRLRIRS